MAPFHCGGSKNQDASHLRGNVEISRVSLTISRVRDEGCGPVVVNDAFPLEADDFIRNAPAPPASGLSNEKKFQGGLVFKARRLCITQL